MNRKTRKILESARANIQRGWCQHAEARTADGMSVGAGSKDAASYCIVGSVWAVTLDQQDRFFAFAELEKSLPAYAHSRVLWFFNDAPSTTRRKVLALFNRALASE